MGRSKKDNAVKAPRRVVRQLTIAALKEVAIVDLEHAKYPIYLDFSDKRFRFSSVRGLSVVRPESVKEVDLSDNALSSLEGDPLPFPNLKRLQLSSNSIVSFSMDRTFNRLDTLDISYNQISVIPEFVNFPSLVQLDLSGNALHGGVDGILTGTKLRWLSLAQNDFVWSEQEFVEILRQLSSSLKRLRYIFLEGNAFVDVLEDRYRPLVAQNMKKVAVLDGIRITKYEKKVRLDEPMSGDSDGEDTFDSDRDEDMSAVMDMDEFDDDSESVANSVMTRFPGAPSTVAGTTVAGSVSGSKRVKRRMELSKKGKKKESAASMDTADDVRLSENVDTADVVAPKFSEVNALLESSFDNQDLTDELLNKAVMKLGEYARLSFESPSGEPSKDELQSVREMLANLLSILSNVPRKANVVLRCLIRLLLINIKSVSNLATDAILGLMDFSNPHRDLVLPVLDMILIPYLKQITMDCSLSTGPAPTHAVGQLYVCVSEARKLIPKDINGLSDPYAIVKFETSRKETNVVPHSLFPRWNAEYVFSVVDVNSQLIIDVFDYDEFSEHDFMGRVVLSPMEVKDEPLDEWVSLEIRKIVDEVDGDIHLTVKYEENTGFLRTKKEQILPVLLRLCKVPDLQHILRPMGPFLVSRFVEGEDKAKAAGAIRLLGGHIVQESFEESAVLDNVIALLPELSKDEKNVELLYQSAIVDRVSSMIENEEALPTNTRRFHALVQTLVNMCSYRPSLVKMFCERSVMTRLSKEFEQLSTGPAIEWKDVSEEEGLGYSLIISAMAALCVDDKVLAAVKNSKLPVRSIHLMVKNGALPCVVEECSRAAKILLRNFLRRRNGSDVSALLDAFFEEKESIMSLLGGSMLSDLCKRVGLNCGVGEVEHRGIFSAVISLVEFVGVASDIQNDLIGNYYTSHDVGGFLSSIQQCLVSLLDFKDDDVRLSAISVLRSLPLEIIEQSTALGLSRFLFNCTWATQGRTEEILKEVLELVSNLVRYSRVLPDVDPDSTPPMSAVLEGMVEGLVAVVLSIMGGNMDRDTSGNDKEMAEKALLSHACVDFLLDLASFETGAMGMKSPQSKEKFADIIRSEERYGDENDLILIEQTPLARSTSFLLSLLPSLRPRGPMAVRLFHRIAQIIEGNIFEALSLKGENKKEYMDSMRNEEASEFLNAGGLVTVLDLLEQCSRSAPLNVLKDQHPAEVLPMDVDLKQEFLSLEELRAAGVGEQGISATRNAVSYTTSNLLLKIKSRVVDNVDGKGEKEDSHGEEHEVAEKEWEKLEMGEMMILKKLKNSQSPDSRVPRMWSVAPPGDHRFPLEWINLSAMETAREGKIIVTEKDLVHFEKPRSKSVVQEALFGNEFQFVEILAGYRPEEDQENYLLEGAMGEDVVGGRGNILRFIELMTDKTALPQGPAAAACLRVVLALICVPDEKLRDSVLEQLRNEDFLVTLGRIGLDSSWCAYDVGSLILLILEELIIMKPVQGEQPPDFVSIYELTSRILRNISCYLDSRLLQLVPLQPKEEVLAAHYSRIWRILSEQLSYVRYFEADDFQSHTLSSEKLLIQDICVREVLPSLLSKVDVSALVKLLHYQFRKSRKNLDVLPDSAKNSFRFLVENYVRDVVMKNLHTQEVIYEGISHADTRTDRVRENVSSCVAEFCALLDKRSQFTFFESIQRVGVAEGIPLRPSFLQELMKRFMRNRYHNAVERLMKLELEFKPDERALESSWLTRVDSKLSAPETLIVLSSRQIYLLRRAIQLECTVCPPEKFCPKPPKLFYTMKYDDVCEVERVYGGHKFTIRIEDDNVLTKFVRQLKGDSLTFSSDDPAVVDRFLKVLVLMCPKVQEIKEDERVLQSIRRCLGDPSEVIMFFSHVVKINRRGRNQNRVIVITDRSVYNMTESSIMLLDLITSGKLMKLKSKHELSELHSLDEDCGVDVGLPRMKLVFKLIKGKRPKFYDMLFGNDLSRELCKRVLELLHKQEKWSVG